MDWPTQLLFQILVGLSILFTLAAAWVVASRILAMLRERRRRAMTFDVQERVAKALDDLADPNNNGLSWIAKPLKPESTDEAVVLKRVMADLSIRLSDEDRWRLAELYEAVGLQNDDMRAARTLKTPWHERAQAAYRLGRMRSASASEALIAALKDPVPEVRLTAIWALSEIGDDRAVGSIVTALSDADGWELMQAAHCLLGMSADLTLPLLDLLRTSGPKRDRRERIAVTVLDMLIEFGLRAHDRLNPRACRQAADDLLRSDSVEIRARAVRALAAVGVESQEDLDALTRCLKDQAWEVRAVAARSLGDINAHSAIPLLCEAASDEAYWVRHNAVFALRKLDEFGRDALHQLLESPDRYAREMAQQALEQH